MGVKWGRAVSTLDAVISVSEDGFDVAELAVELLMGPSDDAFRERARELEATGLGFDVFNTLLPGRVQVTEQGFNIYVWSEYLKRALERVAALGGRKIVWSSGRARLLPIEGEVAAAKRQALQFLFMVSELAESHDIQILVEPLDPRRTNFLNTVAEVAEFLDLAGASNLSAAISLRDLEAIGLGHTEFSRYRDLISHVYLENPSVAAGPRAAPGSGDGYDYSSFFTDLKEIGYSGTITLPESADASNLSFCRDLLIN